jgi:hypothetical protein
MRCPCTCLVVASTPTRLTRSSPHAASDVTSSDSVIYVSVYDRSKAGEGFLGVKEIKPVLRDGCTIDNWFALSPRGDEKVTGEIWLQISYDAVKVGAVVNLIQEAVANCLLLTLSDRYDKR